ncbi:hypothetical protein HXX01_02530 [Candidatus Nomurabacteria bacterium]|nr:hypothetical protein [Candidatus Nomurabacteria bacterium]
MPFDIDINNYRLEVARFLRYYDKITIHQFGPTILYIPVYLVVNDLNSAFNLNIQLVNSNSSDEKTVRNVLDLENSFITDTGSKSLNLGLSELRESFSYDAFHQFAIIERVPLWGLALQNNRKINEIRKRKESGPNRDLSAYWELFGSKFSLLSRPDFKTLNVSIYPEGSTIYRIFKENYLEESSGEVLLAPHSIGITEFDDLFSGTSDVCLTVHPTYAISRSKNENVKLEVVFNHYGPPTPFTSLYLKKFGDSHKDEVAKVFMKYMELLVYDKIKEFYKSDSNYETNSEIYCSVINSSKDSDSSCLISLLSGTNCNKNKECKVPSIIAQQILNDSRIYYHDLTGNSPISQNTLDTSFLTYLVNFLISSNLDSLTIDSIKNFIPHHSQIINADFINEILIGIKDPLFYFTKLCEQLDRLRHKSITFDSNHLTDMMFSDTPLLIFGQLCRRCQVTLEGREFRKVNEEFKITFEYLSENVFNFCKVGINELKNNLIYFDQGIFTDVVFNQFIANSQSMTNATANYHLVQIDADLSVLCILIEYIPSKDFDPHEIDFVKTNPLGSQLLSFWHLKSTENNLHNLNHIDNHGTFTLINKTLSYYYNSRAYALTKRENSASYWLFDFKIVPYKKAKSSGLKTITI